MRPKPHVTFGLSLEATPAPNLRAIREDVRTSWRVRDPELVEIIDNIKKIEEKLGMKRPDAPPPKNRRRAT